LERKFIQQILIAGGLGLVCISALIGTTFPEVFWEATVGTIQSLSPWHVLTFLLLRRQDCTQSSDFWLAGLPPIAKQAATTGWIGHCVTWILQKTRHLLAQWHLATASW